jgi:hypothetical protein
LIWIQYAKFGNKSENRKGKEEEKIKIEKGLGEQTRPRTEASRGPLSQPKRYLLFSSCLADRWTHPVRFFFPGNPSLSLTGNGRLLLPLIPL